MGSGELDIQGIPEFDNSTDEFIPGTPPAAQRVLGSFPDESGEFGWPRRHASSGVRSYWLTMVNH